MTREELIEEKCLDENQPWDKTFLEYFDRTGGTEFLVLEGYPPAPKEVWDKVNDMGGVIGVYHECIKQCKRWEDLLGWNPITITEKALKEGAQI